MGEVINGQDNRIFEDSLRKHIMREREKSYFSCMSRVQFWSYLGFCPKEPPARAEVRANRGVP